EGANVAINYNSGTDRAEAVKAKVHKAGVAVSRSYKAVTVQADVSKEEQVKRMFAEVLGALGSIDILVNNSGIQKPAPSDEVEMADYDKVLGVNLRGAFMCSREAIRHFLGRGGGVIVNN